MKLIIYKPSISIKAMGVSDWSVIRIPHPPLFSDGHLMRVIICTSDSHERKDVTTEPGVLEESWVSIERP